MIDNRFYYLALIHREAVDVDAEESYAELASHVNALLADSEASAVQSIKDRDAALEELAKYKLECQSDVRRHPDFIKMQEQAMTSERRMHRSEQLAEILQERIELCGREAALYKEY